MGIEIERKFLVAGEGWAEGAGVRFRQGYLATEPGRTVRVRVAGDRAFLTIKGEPRGEAKLARLEFEYGIPVQDAHTLLTELAVGGVIDKVRRIVLVDGTKWEVDQFFGENEGLVVAEVEMSAEDEPFARPSWLGDEVSTDGRFANSRLSEHPFATWPEEAQAAVRSGHAPRSS